MNDRRLEQRVMAVAEAALAERGFVTAFDAFLGLAWLSPSSEQAWRQGRVPRLERVVTANLSKISTAMRCFRAWAGRRGVKPSETAYVARGRGRVSSRFSKIGYLGVPHGVELPVEEMFYDNRRVQGGPAPVRAYLTELLGDVLEDRINPAGAFDFQTDLNGIAEAYAMMNERRAIESLVRVGSL